MKRDLFTMARDCEGRMNTRSSIVFGQCPLRFFDSLRAIEHCCACLLNLVVAFTLINAFFQLSRSLNTELLQAGKIADQFLFGRWLHRISHYKKVILA